MGRSLSAPVDAKRGTGHAARLCDPELIRIEQGQHPVRGCHGCIRSLGHALQEEEEPCLPVAALAHLVQERVVIRPALLEEEAQVKHRLAQRALAPEQERDEQPPDAPVPRPETDGWSSNWTCARPARSRAESLRSLRVPEALQVRHALADPVGRRGHEVRPRPACSPPIQFWERRNSPGLLPAPRPRASSRPWISQMRRAESGKSSPRIRAKPCSSAAT